MIRQHHRGLDHRTATERLIDGYLEKIQDELMPDKAKMVVAIRTTTGEYVLGKDSAEAAAAFHKRWPKDGYFMCRVDGTPSGRM
jgi:hypothetical protein